MSGVCNRVNSLRWAEADWYIRLVIVRGQRSRCPGSECLFREEVQRLTIKTQARTAHPQTACRLLQWKHSCQREILLWKFDISVWIKKKKCNVKWQFIKTVQKTGKLSLCVLKTGHNPITVIHFPCTVEADFI